MDSTRCPSSGVSGCSWRSSLPPTLLVWEGSHCGAVAGGIAPGVDGRPDRLGETARRAGIASFVALTCAAFALVWAAFTNDFSVEYILHHTNRDLNTAYKFSALWSGQEGSLLLWAWLLSAYGFVLRMRHRVDVRLSAFASTILAGIQVFFLLLLNSRRRRLRFSRDQWRRTGLG